MPEGKSKENFPAGFWHLADPKISLASLASMFLGTCAAVGDGVLHVVWLAITVLGILAIEVAKNASGEIFDFKSGADTAVALENRSPFSGGKRVIVDGLLTEKQTVWIAAAFYSIGVLSGVLILLTREPSVFWLGLVGIGCAFFYHAPPFKLSYRGLGELAVAVCYGPLICAGTYLVQTGEISSDVVYLSIPLGMLIGAFLWINEFPDYSSDRLARKKTLVVRLGMKKSGRYFGLILGLALLILLLLPIAGLPKTVWLGAIFIIPAWLAFIRLQSFPENTSKIIPAQGLALLSFILYALGTGMGVILN
jgi:1,4-dihydroxy-2-naphthoate octaprenyltransferase